MPRVSRKLIKTTFFHVMTQGVNKNYIFKDSIDKKFYIKTLYTLASLQNVYIDAYCIMDNHSHLLLKPNSIENLSKFMQVLNLKYGVYFNKKYNRVGHVFRDRFKSQGIYSENQYNYCKKYIFNNPVKAGICSSADKYLYSNYTNVICKTEEFFTFIDTEDDTEILNTNIIKNFLTKQNLTIEELKKDNQLLKEFIFFLKSHDFSLRRISEETQINREKIRTIYNKFK